MRQRIRGRYKNVRRTASTLEAMNILAEVIDLRTLKPLDETTRLASVRRGYAVRG